MTIQEYIVSVKNSWDHKRRNRAALEVLMGPMPDIDWPATFRKAGYISYHIKTLKTWTSMHEWCQKNIGKEHYAWTGSVFWFENKEDATLFVLRWS